MSDTMFVVAGLVCVLVWRWLTDPLKHIPTIGPSLPLVSYLGTLRFLFRARDMFQEGYTKYPVFKIAMLDRWLVVVSGAQMNEELRKIPDDQASFDDAAEELVQPKRTIAREAYEHPVHVAAIKEWMPRNLVRVFPGVLEEVECALDDLIPATDNEWLPVRAYATATQLVARASNRVFVGAPLCRDAAYLDIMHAHTANVNKAVSILTFCPRVLRPIAASLLPWQKRATDALRPLLTPVIREKEMLLDASPSAERPNDWLTWCIQETRRIGHPRPEELLIQTVLAANFAAMHTTSATFTHALYHLAASPEWIQPLREDVERATREDGWTKAALGRMLLLDSFLKESQRLNGVSCLSIVRCTLQDITLANGVAIPAGTLVTGAPTSTHRDEALFPDADTFHPLRFANMVNDSERSRRHYVSTSPVDIGFGHGKHACPGRFFAANELKIILACVVMRYDVKFEDEGKRPENEWLAYACYPARRARVLFRRRQAASI